MRRPWPWPWQCHRRGPCRLLLACCALGTLLGTASFEHAKRDPHGGPGVGSHHRIKTKRPQKFELDAPKLTPALPQLEKHWHVPLAIKQAPVRPAAAHGPAAPEVLRQRAVLEQMYGRAGVQEYLDHRDSVQLLDHGRERLRKAVAIAENFASLRLIAEESQVLHVLAEAAYALDARHMKAGRERVYHAYELVESLGPENPSLMRLEPTWTDLGDRCDHSPDCGKFSKCENRRCQPPRFPRTTRVFVTEMLAQLKHRVLEHVWDFGMDELDHHARMWGGNGTNDTAVITPPPAALVRLLLHAGAADPLLQQDRAVIRSLLATAIGSNVPVESVLELKILHGTVQFEVHGSDEVQAANASARAGGLAGLGRAVLEEFDPSDVVYSRPHSGICSTMDVDTECCTGRDDRIGRLNGLQVHDSPCQIVMRATGEWECQPSIWIVQHLQKALKEAVLVVACNATEDVQHITKHVGHKRRRLAEESHVEAHHKVRYRVAHNYAIDDDRVPGGHTGLTHPDLVPHWHRYDSRHEAADKCDDDPECLGYTCNVRLTLPVVLLSTLHVPSSWLLYGFDLLSPLFAERSVMFIANVHRPWGLRCTRKTTTTCSGVNCG
jgi:hypothetical protein